MLQDIEGDTFDDEIKMIGAEWLVFGFLGAVLFLGVYLEYLDITKRSRGKHQYCRYCGEDFGVCADSTIERHEFSCSENPKNRERRWE